VKFGIIVGRIYFWLGLGIFSWAMLAHVLALPNPFEPMPSFIGLAFAGTTIMLIGTNILKNSRSYTREKALIDAVMKA